MNIQKEHSLIAEIMVFKTSINSDEDISLIAPLLDADDRIARWNVDREDIDHVLRIESWVQGTDFVLEKFNQVGIYCEELPD